MQDAASMTPTRLLDGGSLLCEGCVVVAAGRLGPQDDFALRQALKAADPGPGSGSERVLDLTHVESIAATVITVLFEQADRLRLVLDPHSSLERILSLAGLLSLRQIAISYGECPRPACPPSPAPRELRCS